MVNYLTRDGKYLGVEPGTTAVYADRAAGGGWEAVELERQPDGTTAVRFLAANLQLAITPDGKLETRPAGHLGDWEKFPRTEAPPTLMRAGVTLVIDGVAAAPQSGPPRIAGLDFVTDTGARRVLNGCDQFLAYRHFLDGVSLEPLFDESHELGFDMWRVFMTGSVRQNNILDLFPTGPRYYELLWSFAEALNEQGIILLACCYVDNQDVKAGINHWRQMADRLRDTMTLLSGGNEYQKNGFNPGELTDPGMLWSRGSGTGDAAPFKPYGSFAEFHPVRHLPTMLYDSVASPVHLYGQGLNVPLIIDEPIGFAEADKPGSRSADPHLAYRLARHYSTECAGACFHNDSGMRCQVMSPGIRRCAEAWCRGMSL